MSIQLNTTYVPDNVVPLTLPVHYIHSQSKPISQSITPIKQQEENQSINLKDNLTYLFHEIDNEDDVDDFDRNIKTRHDAEPFKSKEDINKILTYFLDKHLKSWNTAQKQPSRKWNPAYLRNYMLIQIGCNCGLRASDLLNLQVGHFIDQRGYYRDITEIVEKKTLNTRKVLKTKIIDVNEGIKSALELYKKYHTNWTRQDYLFPNKYDSEGKPNKESITRQNMDLIIKDVVKKVGLSTRAATHTCRKTMGREFIKQNGNDERSILMLQEIYGHSDLRSTKHYLGLTRDEIRSSCLNLDIGLTKEELTQRGI